MRCLNNNEEGWTEGRRETGRERRGMKGREERLSKQKTDEREQKLKGLWVRVMGKIQCIVRKNIKENQDS